MDYRTVTAGNMIDALENRIGQLEAQHYSNEVYLIEATLEGDKETVEGLTLANASIKSRRDALIAEVERMVDAIREADDSDAG